MSLNNLLSYERVAWGHPDKVADYISDVVVDIYIEQFKACRCAIETMISGNKVFISGEVSYQFPAILDWHNGITLNSYLISAIKNSLFETYPKYKYHIDNLGFNFNISQQSQEIRKEVDGSHSINLIGAGDQGNVWGCKLNDRDYQIFKFMNKIEQYHKHHKDLLPDGKFQVIFSRNTKIIRSITFASHTNIVNEYIINEIKYDLREILKCKYINCDYDKVNIIVKLFRVGCWVADCGMTGRKIISDTYGPWCQHGGGAFSGKDMTKVDRSGAYYAHKLANIQKHPNKVQISFNIGSYYTEGLVNDKNINTMINIIKEFKPINYKYSDTTFDHFGMKKWKG